MSLETGTSSGNVLEIDTKFDGIWSEKNEIYFVELMEAEVLKGNRPTTTFTKSSWNHIEEQMKLYTGHVYTHQQTKNKFNGLRQTYKRFKKLVDHTSGAGWDPASGTITLADDVWETFIKADKRVKIFKKKGCPYFNKLCTIYGDTIATGGYAHPSTQIPSDSDDEIEGENNSKIGVNDESKEVGENSTHSIKKRKKTTISSEVSSAVIKLAEGITELARRKNRPSSDATISCTFGDENESELDKCWKILESMEDVDDETYSKALIWLTNKPNFRNVFIKMSDARRRGFIRTL